MAISHQETRFVFVDAENSPAICEHLKIWMLPSLVLIVDKRTDHVCAVVIPRVALDHIPLLCVCVCIYMCVCVRIYVCICVYICVYMHV
jgi:hypothetical protein